MTVARWGSGTSNGSMHAFAAGIAIACLAVLAGCAGSRRVEESPRPATTATRPSTPTPAPPATTETRTGGPPPISRAWRQARTIRVGLATANARLLVAGSTPWTLVTLGGVTVASGGRGDRVQVARLGAGALEVFREGEMAPIWSGSPAETLRLVPGERGLSGWSGRWYRGTFRIHASNGEGLSLVNEVELESYLRGVLPSEIGNPPAAEYEAVKAQAVAARSYTLSYIGRRAELGFDLWATTEDQVYEGTKRENEQSDRALEETRGEVAVSDGLPVRALYSSTCGGRTSNVEDVWPWPWTSYLRSVRDAGRDDSSYCARSGTYRWTESWSVAEFLDLVRTYAPVEGASPTLLAGSLLDARARSRSRCGRVAELVIETTSGETVLRGDRIRWVLRRPGGKAILRSSFLKIGVTRDSGGRPETVVVSGAGNGHGIGLCQTGALGMARAGKAYREILRHYYKGAGFAVM